MHMRKREIYYLILLITVPALLVSCASSPGVKPPASIELPPRPLPAGGAHMSVIQPMRSVLHHTVAPGETLWRISKMYDVDVETLKAVNGIKDVTDIDIGTRLVIPEAAPRKEVITLYPSKKWKYIIIHHSATDKGNCQLIDAAHKNRGWKCVGYHFVIDNGTSGKEDGQIETSPRWTKQQDGAHCKASGMNSKGIGICLVGNFSEGKISRNQMRSLIYLVKQLKKYYRIPNSRILGHGRVPDAKTECPGTKFPWREFYSQL